LGSRSNQRIRSRSGSRGSRSGSRGGRSASKGSRSAGVEEDADTSESRHQAELLLGDGPPKPGTEKTGRGAHYRDSQPIASGLSQGEWNNNEQGEEGRGGAPSPYIGARDFAGPHLHARGEDSPSRASPRQPPRRRAGGGEIASGDPPTHSRETNPSGVSWEPGGEELFGLPQPGPKSGHVRRQGRLQPWSAAGLLGRGHQQALGCRAVMIARACVPATSVVVGPAHQ
jgi:hypothetical protein